MRDTNEQITIELKFPYDKPDANGVMYSKQAIQRAFEKGIANLPIMFLDNNGNEKIIGITKNDTIKPEWDDANGVCKCIINGTIFYAGTSCRVNEINNGVVNDFEITSVGLSV